MNIMKLLIGFVLGMATAVAALFVVLSKKMLQVRKSNLSFDETVAAVQEEAQKRGWNVPHVYDIQSTLAKAGHTDMNRIKIISVCQPHHAYKILKPDANKAVTGMMPCRVSVFETESGEVFVGGMDLGLMSKLFGSPIRGMMGTIASEQEEILARILQS
jgi:uncharacterized protein (DUF302 family)